MAVQVKLAVTKRTKLGSAESRRLRRKGLVPGNIYGHKQDPVPVAVPVEALRPLVYSGAHVVECELDGKTESTILREVQWDAMGDYIQHFDLLRIDPNERVSLEIPIELRGTAPGVLAGGILEQPLRHLHIQCLASQLVDSIVVRIGHLDIGGTIHVSDLELPPNVTTDNPPEAIVVHVVAAREVSDEELAASAGPAEPEVIARKKAEEDEG